LNASWELEGEHQTVSVSIANPSQLLRIAGEKAEMRSGKSFIFIEVIKNCPTFSYLFIPPERRNSRQTHFGSNFKNNEFKKQE